ncbi:MAG: YicC family protein [Flavobacteriales bacterium]|nr:YicC family protein [Flavobacteriales bacterium]
MTGFGKATGEVNNKKITVEIKSLNSKQADIFVRMPSFYKEKELPLRSKISKNLERGKIEFNLYAELLGDSSSLNLNKELFKKYYEEFNDAANDVDPEHNSDIVAIISKMPDLLKAERSELDENEWIEVSKIIEDALTEINDFRSTEGSSLEKELTLRVDNISKLLKSVEQYEKERIETVKTRILNNLKEVVADAKIDKDRFEQELIYYIEKYDVTEEKIRLSQHCTYFIETMNSSISEGKKLGFITQEMGREINTLGSKANHSELQKIVVQMKDELEKIKEQILNIL